MSENTRRKRAREVLTGAGYRIGGHIRGGKEATKAVHEHERNMHPGKKPTALKLKSGGIADGMDARPRAGRKNRGGGKGKSGHTIVVVNAGAHPTRPVPVPKPVPVPVPAGPPGGAPGMGPTPDMNAMGPGGPPGMPPPGAKRGGRTRNKLSAGGMPKPGEIPIPKFKETSLKRGGKASAYPIDDGALTGEARLEKAKAYGAKR